MKEAGLSREKETSTSPTGAAASCGHDLDLGKFLWPKAVPREGFSQRSQPPTLVGGLSASVLKGRSR